MHASAKPELGGELVKSCTVCSCPRCSSVHLTCQSASLLQQRMLKDENQKTVLDPKMFQKEAHFLTSPSYNKSTAQLSALGTEYISLVF